MCARVWMIALASFLLALCCALPARAADQFESVRQFIRAELVERSVPSIAVAVAKDGKIIWEEGFGWANREKRIEATQHTAYSLASISKPITATGLMTLVQAGKIDLDKSVNDYLGKAKLRARIGDANAATVRRVANHTSGLPLHAQFFYADEPFKRPSMDETILRYGNLVTAPGETSQYSNLGYGVLDYLIERVSGRSYVDFMRREVFLPLGMTRTSVDIGPGFEGYAAARYGKDGLPIPFYDFDHPGASAVFASAHDLVRFGLFHLKAHLRDQKAILSDSSIDEMHRRTAGTQDKGYGVGFDVRTRNATLVVSHSGNMSGVSTQMQLFPAEKLAIVVLSNSNSQLPADTAERIASELLPNWRLTSNRSPSELAPFTTPDSLLGIWKGSLATYVKDLPVELRFLSSGEVQAKVGDQLTTLVDQARFKEGEFSGRLVTRIGTPDTERFAYEVALTLQLRGEALNGSAIALAVNGARSHFGLAHWVRLERQQPQSK